jgi:hypothetical protein
MNFYNDFRPHQAMNNQFPMAAWRAGMDRIEAARTVDMPLRLDNANALVSRPAEFHRQPLAEPSVKLSPHWAPIRQTRRSCAIMKGLFVVFVVVILLPVASIPTTT